MEKSLTLPDLDAIDWKASAQKDLKDYDRDEQLLRIFLESGPFERLQSLVSFEASFIHMYEEPEAFLDLMDALTTFRIDLIRRLKENYQPDAIITLDDLGSKNAPLISVDMYREFIKPFHKRLGDAIHEMDMIYIQHSCGNMESFVGDLIDAGVDALNPVQANCNNQKNILKKYGDKVSIDGGLDFFVHYDTATEEELRQEVRRACDLFGPYKNFILHDATVVPKNLQIIRDEARKYGRGFYTRGCQS